LVAKCGKEEQKVVRAFSISTVLNETTFTELSFSSKNFLVNKSHTEVNPLAPELFFLISSHPVYKMLIIQEPKKLAL
jgi:hypothetical protein